MAEVVSVRDGKWSEPGTWDGGKVPGDGDWVEVAAATRVEYDVVSEAVLPVVQVRGELIFARDRDTALHVCALQHSNSKIPVDFTAELENKFM